MLNIIWNLKTMNLKSKSISSFIFKLFFIWGLLQIPLHARGLPDTGQILCDDGNNTMVACSQTNTGDGATYPNQDGRYGRDAAAQSGVLIKVGAGHAGFDYTKVCNSGEKEGSGNCPANPTLGNGANDWGCTYDNITELLWEVKTDDGGLRDKDWSYSWYSADTNTNAGEAGTENGGACVDSSNCDTEKYTAQVNATGLCGFNDWSLPRREQLYTLRNLNASNPGAIDLNFAIDINYFPNTRIGGSLDDFYWSASSYVTNPSHAWGVYFDYGNGYARDKSYSRFVRLVRGGQSFNPLEQCDANNANGNAVVSTPTHDFIQQDATVIHQSTTLTWDRCSLGQTWDINTSNCTGTTKTYTWQNALKEVNNRNSTNYLGFNDWRLPNINEFQSISETCGFNPAINQIIFPSTSSSFYWSASSYVAPPSSAWYVDFGYGNVYANAKSDSWFVRLARGGQSFDTFKGYKNNSDTTPDTFNFTNQTDITINTLTTSNSITVTGINNPTAISIANGEYEIDGDNNWRTTPNGISKNQTVKVRQTSSATNATITNTILTIGGITDTFSLKTEGTLKGDANGDSVINVNDIITMVNIILNSNPIVNGSDCNNNGLTNVNDIICTINIILGE